MMTFLKIIWNIAANDLRMFFSQTGNLVSLLLIPLGFTLVLGWTSGGGNDGLQQVRIDVLDQDQSEQSAHLLEEIRIANETLILCPMDNDVDDFCQLEGGSLELDGAILRAQEERTNGLIVIPAGYSQRLANFESVKIDFYAAGDPTLPNAVEETMNAVLQKMNTASLTAGVADALLDNLGTQTGLGLLFGGVQAQFVDDLYQDAQSRITQRPAGVRYVSATEGEASETTLADGFGQSIPGMGSMFVMFTVLGGMAVLFRERSQWTLQRLAALPISRAQILGGKALTYVILGMIQFAIVFGVGLMVDLNFGSQPLLILPIMIAFVLCSTAIAFAIAPYVTSESQANGIARLLGLTLAPLGGAWWPLEIVPDFMRVIGYLSPIAWAMSAFQDVMWYGGGMVDILPEIGVLLAATVILFFFGVRGFRYTS